MHLIEQSGLIDSRDWREFHCSVIFCSQPYRSFGTQNDSIVLSQPIHVKDNVYALGIQNDKVCQEFYPLMVILTDRHICFILISPPGELTSMVCFIIDMGRWHLATNADEIKECDAPESNKIVAGCELAKNIPSTTSWACWASSILTWLTVP
jgi:hypothetical protein